MRNTLLFSYVFFFKHRIWFGVILDRNYRLRIEKSQCILLQQQKCILHAFEATDSSKNGTLCWSVASLLHSTSDGFGEEVNFKLN